MITILGYQIFSKIHKSPRSIVYRGQRQDGQPVILKVLHKDYPTPEEIAKYKLEYKIIRNLNIPGVIKSYCLEKYKNSLAITFEDFGGESLNKLISQQRLSILNFLNLAIGITENLSLIHSANIIHKDINPSNIVFNSATGQVKIIDFGISTVLSREIPTIRSPNVLEGTLGNGSNLWISY